METKEACAVQNGVVIVRTANNCFAVAVPGQRESRPLRVQVDYLGRLLKDDCFDAARPYRDSLGVDILLCMIRVMEGDRVLAQIGSQPQGRLYQPWMVVQGEQGHVTESSVSVPPALHVTDECGDRWTLGFRTAPPEESPRGEFAFDVLRNGLETGETASRIERRSGNIWIFTRRGWKRLSASRREFL